MTTSRTTLAALGLAVSLALVTGCSAAPGADEATGDRKGQEIADAATRQDAADLADELEAVSWLEKQVYLEAQVPRKPSRHLYGGETTWALLASSRSTDGDERPVFRLTVRIREHFVPGSTSDWDPPGEATVARCFDFVVVRDEEVEPEEADCPDGDPLRVPAGVRVPPRPSVHDRDRQAVRAFLREGGGPADVHDLAARLGRGLTPYVEQRDGTVAVAVTARPDGDDCVVAQRTADGRVTVWTPDRMVTMPGEYGCSPQVALDLPPGYVAGA